ncbi:MAG TPA: CvpA family protein [Steroidobacteraceae bacterium]|nr:CvpA family protein [Steroidobacteraceae bacterium]
MQGADYMIVAGVGISIVVGTMRGFVREIVALASWLAAIWVAWRFSGFLHPYLGGVLETPEQKTWAARAILLLAVLLLGALVGAVLSWLTRTAAGLSVIDRVLGFVFGCARGALLAGFAVLLGHALRLEHESWWKHSKLMPYAEYVAAGLESFAGESRQLARRALSASAAVVGAGGD